MNLSSLCLRTLQLAPAFARSSRPAVVLRSRELWSAPMRQGQRVICERGVLWLTQSGDATDYLLRKGESFTAQARGRVVAQALEDSRLRVEEHLSTPGPAPGSR